MFVNHKFSPKHSFKVESGHIRTATDIQNPFPMPFFSGELTDIGVKLDNVRSTSSCFLGSDLLFDQI